MRLFIASGFSASVLDRVRDLQDFARPLLGDHVKWVEPVNIHLTYAFLGDIAPASEFPVIRKSIDEAAGAFRRPPVTLGGFGAFPSLERPRVLWVGLKEGGDAIRAIALKLYGSLLTGGFVLENDFSAHITIARVKTRPDRAHLKCVEEKAEELDAGDTVASIGLMESRLTSAGPEYRTLYSKELL